MLAPVQPETPRGTAADRPVAPFRSAVLRGVDGALQVAYAVARPTGYGKLRDGTSLRDKPHIWATTNPPVVGYQWAKLDNNWILVGFDRDGQARTTNSTQRLLGLYDKDGGPAHLYPENKTWGVGGFVPPYEVDIPYADFMQLPRLWKLEQPPVGMTYTRMRDATGTAFIGILAYDINGRIIAGAPRLELAHRNDKSIEDRIYDETAGRVVKFLAGDPIGGLLNRVGLGFVDDAVNSAVGRFGLNTTDLFAIGALSAVMLGPMLVVSGGGAAGAGISTGGAVGYVGAAGTKRASTKVAGNLAARDPRINRLRGGANRFAPVLAPAIESAINTYQGNAAASLEVVAKNISAEVTKRLTDPSLMNDAASALLVKTEEKGGKLVAKLDPEIALSLARDVKMLGGAAAKERIEKVRRAGPLDLVDELNAASATGIPPLEAADGYVKAARAGMAPIRRETLDKALAAGGRTLESLRRGIPANLLAAECGGPTAPPSRPPLNCATGSTYDAATHTCVRRPTSAPPPPPVQPPPTVVPPPPGVQYQPPPAKSGSGPLIAAGILAAAAYLLS